jgi:AsmA protein
MFEKNRTFRRLLFIVAALVTLLVIVVLAGSLLLPSHLIGPRIARLVQQKTGRELRIAESISFSLVPRFGLVAHDVRLSSPAGGFSHDFFSADEIDIGLDPIALLRGEILVDYLLLSHPSITFEIDPNGDKNWVFHPLESAPSSVAEPTSHAAVTSFAASGMTIASGMLSYIDDRSRVMQTVTDMDLTLSMTAFEQPLDAKGNLTYNGEPLAISVTLTNPNGK